MCVRKPIGGDRISDNVIGVERPYWGNRRRRSWSQAHSIFTESIGKHPDSRNNGNAHWHPNPYPNSNTHSTALAPTFTWFSLTLPFFSLRTLATFVCCHDARTEFDEGAVLDAFPLSTHHVGGVALALERVYWLMRVGYGLGAVYRTFIRRAVPIVAMLAGTHCRIHGPGAVWHQRTI